MKVKSTYSFWKYSIESVFIGAIMGLVLSILYASIFVAGAVSDMFSSGALPPYPVEGAYQPSPIVLWTIIITFFLFAIALVGIIPSIIGGTITAFAISTTFWLLKKWLSAFLSITIATVICYGLSTLVSILWTRMFDEFSFLGTYDIWWYKFPKIIYIITGGYMGWKLFKRLSNEANNTIMQIDVN